MSGPSQSASRMGGAKEQEVDALTDLLVQGMENEPEGDCYGICVKCHEKVRLFPFYIYIFLYLPYFGFIFRSSVRIADALPWNSSTTQNVSPVTIAQSI